VWLLRDDSTPVRGTGRHARVRTKGSPRVLTQYINGTRAITTANCVARKRQGVAGHARSIVAGCAVAVALAALGAQGGCRVATSLQVTHAARATPPPAAHPNGSGVTTSGLDPSGPTPPR
jgi:hypothetical protein